MRYSLKRLPRQLNRRQIGVILLVLLVAEIGVGLFLFINTLSASPSMKPSVLIIDDTTGGGGTASSAASIQTYLDSTGQFTTTKVTTATWPTAQTAASTYDAVIYSAGNRTTPLSTTERDWLNSYLNTYSGHLIVEGEAVLGSHTGDSIIKTNILKTTGYSSSYSSTNIRMTNVIHPVTYGMSTTSSSYTSSTSYWVGHSSSGNGLGAISTRRRSTNILSAWEGIVNNKRARMVFIDFDWDNWSSQAQRQTLLSNSVKWVSEFCELQVTSMAPADGVSKGTKDVKMAKLKFSTYATAPNSNTNTITSFAVYDDGTAATSSIKLVRLYEADSLGNITLANPVGQALMGANRTTVMKVGIPVTAGTDLYYVLTYDISDPADESETLKVRIGTADTFTTRERGPVKINGSTSSNITTILNITKPDIPLYVKATNQGTGSDIRLDWHAVSTWDAVGYNVYRAVDYGSGMGSFTKINPSVVASIYYTDSSLTEFNRYYYKIRSVDSSNNESLDSDIVTVIPNRPPKPPTGLTIGNPGTGGCLNLSWTPAATPEPADPFNNNLPDLAGYNIYASIAVNGTYLKVNPHPVTDTSYVHTGLTDNVTYYYKVVAVDRYGSESSFTPVQSNTSTDTTAPEIIDRYPGPSQDYVDTTASIRVKFDDILDTSGDISQWIKLEQKNLDNTYTEIPGAVSYDESRNELVFTPGAPLSTVGNFRVTVKGGTGGCENHSGLTLIEDSQWTFGTLLNPHADFKNNNTLCGYCHSAHSAEGTEIIRAPNAMDLCFSCHDGTGSSYDVKGGRYFNGKENVPLAAGGYDLSMGSTSTHFTDLANYVYGSPGLKLQIECITCHDPHGTTNFRNIRTVLNGSPVTLTAVVYGPSYSVKTSSGYEVVSYVYGWEQLCGACHSEYQIYHSVTSMTGEENWRHRTNVPLSGGSTDGRWVVSYPGPGLYTTLPTVGATSGANITNAILLSGGSLGAGTYNYVITATNSFGESVYGNIVQVVNPGSAGKIELVWDRIQNAYKYRIYRYKGSGDPGSMDISQFEFIAEVPDYPVEYVDNGAASDPAISPPVTSSAKVSCITCHFPHGTSAVNDNGDPTRLRRYSNDGLCEDCHKK